ncbi:hypothetical protein [Halopiger aswanensis]|uniref:Uncharacterized protein n=1 Tax=Halopiger aswanensis TaxID=148449 RepID=A0A419WE80_9EURY|nr:hypothetical protein [Halopiger aswanensis]RKD93765.1 hypothetical protein ATJ93_3397 [Halopiger aswanensis]
MTDRNDDEAVEEARQVGDAIDDIGVERLSERIVEVYRESLDSLENNSADGPVAGDSDCDD